MADGIHVRKKGERWLVERGNYLLGEFKRQDEAIQLGRERALIVHADLLIHGQDGAVLNTECFPDVRKSDARQSEAR